MGFFKDLKQDLSQAVNELTEDAAKITSDESESAQETVPDDDVMVDTLNEEMFKSYLMTKDLADVDLLIRTSGEERISNFLLYQIAYSELVFTDVNWPDFDEKVFDECLATYQNRKRRFGGLNK